MMKSLIISNLHPSSRRGYRVSLMPPPAPHCLSERTGACEAGAERPRYLMIYAGPPPRGVGWTADERMIADTALDPASPVQTLVWERRGKEGKGKCRKC